MFINGKWVGSAENETLKAYCPATGDELCTFQDAAHEDVSWAAKAARQAFTSWSKTTVKERAAMLNKIADIID